MASRFITRAAASATGPGRRRGLILAPGLVLACAFGRSGTGGVKREGDGRTPCGRHRLVAVLYRPDRVPRPRTGLPVAPIAADLGWCDDPRDRRYNRPVRLPFAAGHERLWRDDRLYDLLAILDYNLPSPRPGGGSAIFLHVAAPGLEPTAGCVATGLAGLAILLSRCGPGTVLEVR